MARGVSVEEGYLPDVDTLPRPAGFGTEDTRSAQSFAEIATYTVPDGTIALLREVSFSLEANGEALASLAGVNFGPFTGSGDFSVPLDPGVLTPGDQIRILHQSTDGTNTTTKAQVVVLEV